VEEQIGAPFTAGLCARPSIPIEQHGVIALGLAGPRHGSIGIYDPVCMLVVTRTHEIGRTLKQGETVKDDDVLHRRVSANPDAAFPV
jgi:hypothetical protein